MFVREIYVIRSVNYFNVRQNELNPWVRKHTGIKFYAWNYFRLFGFIQHVLVLFQPGKLRASNKTVFIYLHVQLLIQ